MKRFSIPVVRFLFLFFQFGVNGLLESRQIPLGKNLSIYENCGRPPHVGLTGVIHLPFNQRPDSRVFQIPVELFQVQPKLLNDCLHFGIAEFFLVGVQFFMDLPELSLFSSSQRRNGRLSGKTVHRQRKVFHNQFHFVRIFLQHLLEQGLKPRAVGSLVIRKNGDRNCGVQRSFEWESRQINFKNGFEEEDLEGFLLPAGEGEHIGPR